MKDDMRRDAYAFRTGGSAAPVFNAPSAVLALIGVLVAIHAVIGFMPPRAIAFIDYYGALSPRLLIAAVAGHAGLAHAFAPFVTHIFLHASWMHVGMNSVWLLVFGAPVARRLGAGARLADKASLIFFLFFVLSGVAGALTFVAIHPFSDSYLIGASGGVTGLLGGLVRFAFQRPAIFGGRDEEFAGLTDKPVLAWTVGLLIINALAAGFGGLLAPDAGAIAWEAHLGGYFFGLLTFPAFAKSARRV